MPIFIIHNVVNGGGLWQIRYRQAYFANSAVDYADRLSHSGQVRCSAAGAGWPLDFFLSCMERDGHQFPVFAKDDLPGEREQAENALQESLQVQLSEKWFGWLGVVSITPAQRHLGPS